MTDGSTSFADARSRQSEELAFRAETAWAVGGVEEARELFAQAAELEEAVAREVSLGHPRIQSVLAISAVALWYKAANFDRAKRLAYTFLASADALTEQGTKDLEELVDRCSRAGELRQSANDVGMIPVEVKLDGGRVLVGAAPAMAAKRRRECVTSLLMRSAELEAGHPYRERGGSELDRDDEIQIYEVPALAAIYGLRFYVATGTQQTMNPTVTPEQVVERFLSVASAAAAGPDAIRAAVPDAHYAQAFIDGFCEGAPDGKDVAVVTYCSPTWKMPRAPRVVFESRHRDALRVAAASPAAQRDPKKGEKLFEGRLLSAHLTSGDKWIMMQLDAKKDPDLIMVEDKKLRLKIAAIAAAMERETSVRVLARYSPKARRWVMTDVTQSRR